MELITIQLTKEDAELFKKFREHQDEFKKLLENGVFDFLVGQKILHKSGLKVSIIETRDFKRLNK